MKSASLPCEYAIEIFGGQVISFMAVGHGRLKVVLFVMKLSRRSFVGSGNAAVALPAIAEEWR
jgi:hypothetical protein